MDPDVQPGAVQALGLDLELVDSFEECVARADVLVLAAPPQRCRAGARRRTVTHGDRSPRQRGSGPGVSASEWNGRTVLIIGGVVHRLAPRDGAGRSRRGTCESPTITAVVPAQPGEVRSIAPLEIREEISRTPGWRPAPAPGCTPSSISPSTTAVADTSTPARPARRTTSRWTWACSAPPPAPAFPRSCSPLVWVRLSQLPADRPDRDLAARRTGRPALHRGPHVRLGEGR